MFDDILEGAKVAVMGKGDKDVTAGQVRGAAIAGILGGMAIQGYRHNKMVQSGETKEFTAFLF